jgi:carbonic anhydrase
MNRKIAAAAVCLTLSATKLAMAQHHHWGYSGEAHHKTGAAGSRVRGVRNRQKPVAGRPRQSHEGRLASCRRSTTGGHDRDLNNGHRSGNYQPGSSLTIDDRSFELKQFHFHAPSENTFNGKHFPLEGHLVHADKDGNLAVVAVMFSEGAANPLLASLWKTMPAKEGEKKALADPLSAMQMLPAQRLHGYRLSDDAALLQGFAGS